MKKVLAVSGGIDSVVMLHMLKDDPEVVVAHFDHGIRTNSWQDRLFVERLADEYGLRFLSGRLPLGAHTSEEEARARRYEFLRSIARAEGGRLFVAHHADDVLETIAINLIRGTGWRGLAPFYAPDLDRPLLTMRKKDLLNYAALHQLHFRQDQTNNEPDYLRNRIRVALNAISETKKNKLLALYQKQVALRDEIESELNRLVRFGDYLPTQLLDDDIVAPEILRTFLARHKINKTRPQLRQILTDLKNLPKRKRYSLDATHFLEVGESGYLFTTI